MIIELYSMLAGPDRMMAACQSLVPALQGAQQQQQLGMHGT